MNCIHSYNNFDLKNFNTLKISSTASCAYFPANERQMAELLSELKCPYIIGGGSNTLFSSLGVRNPLIFTKDMAEISIDKDTVEVEAGAKVQRLSKAALDNSLSGFEFLIGIPASLGGCVVMNAGAHGQCIAESLISARVYDTFDKKVYTFLNKELDFSYRNSIVKENSPRYVVLSAKFKLEKKSRELIEQKMNENTEFRKRVQPNLSEPNIGSVFKNPLSRSGEKLSAGMLIDKCGLRGYVSGGAKVYENHANFVINYNNCTSSDYTNVVYKMYDSVVKKFDIKLEPEIIYIGKMSEEEEEKWKVMKRT